MTPAEILVPGLAQWNAGRPGAAVCLGACVAGFAGLLIAAPFLLQDPDASYPLLWDLLARAPTRGGLVRGLSLGMLALTWLAGLADAAMHRPPPYAPRDDDGPVWRAALGLWLREGPAAALTALEPGAPERRRDPLWHLLRARLLADAGRPDEARDSLALCARHDEGHLYESERARVRQTLQGDPT